MDYKDTLHMPQTDFEMRGNLPTKEPLILARWEKNNHYQRLLAKNAGQKSFVLHDGPPYANNNLHAGTAMNRIIKDIIVRSKAMEGYYTPFFPGWDTHGLPIENAIQKLGVDRKKMSPAEFRKRCEEYAYSQIELQMGTEKRLGQVADYEHPYISLQKSFEARQVRSFAKMALDGLIFQGLKPIYWSPYNETAIADSEIVYFDKTDPTIYVSFSVLDGKGILDQDVKFVIWTTTPWTIPANMAIALNPDYDYSLIDSSNGKFILLASLVENLAQKFGLIDVKVLKHFKGSELEWITTKHPLYDRETLVINADYVTGEDGTGAVHIAPAHGLEDFYASSKYHLEVECPVDAKGYMTSIAGKDLEGLFVEDCSKKVIELLKENGSLMALENITHSYPHDDRLKKPVIFRATTQWFASIDKIKEKLLKAVKEVEWLNEWGEVRLSNMIKEREDWCISRQRLWGVPIPVIYAEDGSPIIEEKVFNHIAELFEQFGSNVWFEREAKDLLPEGYTHPNSPNNLFSKEKDIMDVWFDSGSSWNELIARGYSYPADLYFEGSDQYRGWFNSSLIVSVANHGVAPYKAILSHGYVTDAKGEKMSKSVGNTVNPLDVIAQYGADVLRLWAATVDFKSDMRIGEVLLKQTSDTYRKVRNTFRFMLGNIHPNDFCFEKDAVDYPNLERIDQYFLVRLMEISRKVKEAYRHYDFIAVSNLLSNFMSNELSSYYLDFGKDILYIESKASIRRRSMQTVIYRCVDVLVRLWSPILAFTSDEIWQHFRMNEEDSVHYSHFLPEINFDNEKELNNEFNQLGLIRNDVLKALEEARGAKIIGKPLEAKISLAVNEEDRHLLLKNFGDKIHQWLLVSNVEFVDKTETYYERVGVGVTKAEGVVCPRCWNISHSLHKDNLCERCNKIMNEKE